MSIIRPEKRDPNHIRNKSDIGLSKVDNVSSAEFASIVLDQVKRHLNRETIYQTSGRRFIALAKISCKSDGSGNLIKILSGNLFITFAVLNDSEDVREAAKLEAIYTHSTNGTEADTEDDTARVEYNLFMTEKPALLNECYIEFRENVFENAEGNKINEMYVVLRCDAANLPFVSINLFEYSNGGVALDPTTLEDNVLGSYTLISSARCDHNRFSLVDRSESTLGFEIYDDNGTPIRVKETDDSINSDYDIPRINDIPFTGRRNVFVEGKNTRQIKITAKHSGASNSEAGDHNWDVLTYAPRTGYTYYKDANADNRVISDIVTPQLTSFLDKDTFDVVDNGLSTGYGYGMCRLSGCETTLSDHVFEEGIDYLEKIRFVNDWVKSLSKNESDVISVKIFKIFAEAMTALLMESLKNSTDFKDAVKTIVPSGNDSLKDSMDRIYPTPITSEGSDPCELGFRYIFDYAQTSDSVTIVPHSGMENKAYDIKLGVVGLSKSGTKGIDLVETANFVKGGDCGWVNIVGVDRKPNESATITFSFLPNTTDKERYGYYIIPSTQPGINLVYRFYQDVVTSNLRIRYTDENNKTEYYAFDTVIRKTVKNTAEKYIFDNISIVDNTILDELGNPTELDRMLDYKIENNYENSTNAVDVKVIRNEQNLILGFEVDFSNNSTNVDRVVSIHIREAGTKTRNIMTFQITQSARELEFTVPESVTLEGRMNDSSTFTISSNKTWCLSIIKGDDFVSLSKTRGEVGAEEDSKDFEVTVTADKNNISSTAKEIAILKLYAEGNESQYKRIFIYQNGSPAMCSLQGRTVLVPYKKDGIKKEEFYCTYDWEIVLDEELKKWCSVSPESGKECTEDNPTSVTFTALETTKLTSTREGIATIKYADGATTEITVRQEAAKFDFTLSGGISDGKVSVSDNTEADPVAVTVSSNYDWNIGIEHADSDNKRFSACIDRVEGQMDGGVNGSSIYVYPTKNSTSDSESTKLGKVKIYALGTVVKEFDVYQDKVGVTVKLSPGTKAGWLADGTSKQGGTQVTIPVTFTPDSAIVSATYAIDGGTPSAATVTKDSEGKATITLPGIGANPKGKESRSISVTVKAGVGELSKTDTCTMTQDGYENGIRVTKEGSSTDYYGGTRATETAIYFTPKKETKTVNTLYIPIGASKLDVSVPNWLSISEGTDSSKGDYLLKIRETVSINNTSSDRTGTIKITSGSGNDKTEATISVTQYKGSWTFGEVGETNYSSLYTYEKPYELTVNPEENADAVMNFVSFLSYGVDKKETVSCTASIVEGSDWLEAGVTKGVVETNLKVTVKSKSSNSTGKAKTAIVKITQEGTESAFYIKVTQKVSTKLYITGGVKDVKYVFVNSSSDSISLTATQGQTILNKATVITGKGGILYTNTNGYILDNISYVDTTGGNISIKTISELGSGETLYIASIAYDSNKGTTVTGLTSNYSYDDSYSRRSSFTPSKATSSSIYLSIQGFGSNKITLSSWLDLGSQILERGYEYILTNSPNSIYWDSNSTTGVILHSDYYFYIDPRDLDINSEIDYNAYYFTVDNSAGVGFFTDKSVNMIQRSTEPVELFVYRRPKYEGAVDPGNPQYRVWSGCGTVLWTPVDLNPTVNWYV